MDNKSKSFEEIDIFRDDKKRQRALIFGALIVIIIACAVIMGLVLRNADGVSQLDETTESSPIENETEAVISADTSIPFTICEDEAITSLAQNYFAARLSGDSSTIYSIFGRSDTSADETLEERLKAQADWIQNFNDIIVYTVPGTTDDEFLCLVTYSIDFRRTDTMAPGVMYFFAEKGENGDYTILETLTKEKVDYANAFLESDSASSIIDDIDSELSTSLASDSTMALIYTSFVNGDIYADADLDSGREQDVNIVFNAEDSILVGESALENMEAEALEAASREESENALDSSEYEESLSQSSTGESESSEADPTEREGTSQNVGPGYETTASTVSGS